MDRSLFFGGGLGNFQKKKILTQQKLLKKKIVQGEPSALYHPGHVFDLEKKILAQSKGEKKTSCSRKLPNTTPPPQLKKKVHPLLVMDLYTNKAGGSGVGYGSGGTTCRR